MNINSELNTIIWGNQLFVNGQFISKLLALISAYKKEESDLETIFKYVHAIKEQKRVKLYRDLTIQLEEITTLEDLLITREVTIQERSVINYTINNVLLHFTKSQAPDLLNS